MNLTSKYENKRKRFFKLVNLNRAMKKENAGKRQYVLIPTITIDLYDKNFNPMHLYYNSVGLLAFGWCLMFYYARKPKKDANT